MILNPGEGDKCGWGKRLVEGAGAERKEEELEEVRAVIPGP